MNDYFLHDLNRIPRNGQVWLIGPTGRSRRFQETLRRLRPDVRVTRTINDRTKTDDDSIGGEYPDRILITTPKYRRLLRMLEQWPAVPWHVVNPNFCHPFVLEEGNVGRAARLEQIKRLLATDRDRAACDLFRDAVHLRLDLTDVERRRAELHKAMGEQYFDFIKPEAIRTIIEGGLGDGDTTLQFHNRFDHPVLHGFEPDTEALEGGRHKAFLDECANVHIHPLGLWHGRERLSFHIESGGKSTLHGDSPADRHSTDSSRYVDTISIDEFVEENSIQKVDFIKLDIEGAEPEALRGAERTLKLHRPQLAVCIYHRFEHYYEIPLWLADRLHDYVFRIGLYSDVHVFSETVLYGMPGELNVAN